ncbi:MAG: lipid II flippase MurJ, partial [Oceanipulchritudo sp.]
LPAALGLILLAGPVLGFLFEWGLFAEKDVREAVPVLMVAATGLPFFAWSTLLTRAWYARQEMRIPVYLAGGNLLLNLILGLILMRVLGAPGLALANTLSAAVHCLTLQLFLPGKSLLGGGLRTPLALLAGLAVMGAGAVAGLEGLTLLGLEGKVHDLVSVSVLIPLLAVIYAAVLWMLRCPLFLFMVGRGG